MTILYVPANTSTTSLNGSWGEAAFDGFQDFYAYALENFYLVTPSPSTLTVTKPPELISSKSEFHFFDTKEIVYRFDSNETPLNTADDSTVVLKGDFKKFLYTPSFPGDSGGPRNSPRRS